MADINLHHEVDRLRQRLIDLSLRNRLLNYRRSKNRTLDIVDELPDTVFERLVVNGKHFTFAVRDPDMMPLGEQGIAETELPVRDESQPIARRHTDTALQTLLDEPMLDKVLTHMRRETRSAIDETGVNLLYLALGMLEWYEDESSSTPRYAPLILVPVIFDPLKKPAASHQLKLLHTGDEIIGNLSLSRLLEKNYNLTLPDFVDGMTPEQYFNAVRGMDWRDPRWQVRRHALLGFFSFHKIQMFFDLDPENWQDDHAIGKHPVLPRLIQGGDIDGGAPRFLPDYDVDEHDAAKQVVLVDNADSSQHSALCDIAAGNSLVIEGPPGTGKSQTITNAIADALHKKKTVLFVAEKLAALDVVKRRLDKLGLGDLTLSLHSDKGSLAEVYRDIGQRIDATFRRPGELAPKRRELEQCQAQLKAYVQAVTEPVGPREQPLHDVFWHAVNLRGRGVVTLGDLTVSPTIDRDGFTQAINDLHVLARHGSEVGNPTTHPWRGFMPQPLTSNQLPDIGAVLDALATRAQAMHDVLAMLNSHVAAPDSQWLRCVRAADPRSLSQTLVLPEEVEPTWCPHLLTDDRRATALSLANDLDAYHAAREEAARWSLNGPLEATSPAAAIIAVTDRGALRFIHDATLTEARTLRTTLGTIQRLLDDMQAAGQRVEALGLGDVRHRAEYEQAVARLKLLAHPVAAGEHGIGAAHFTAQAADVFKQAKQRHDQLAAERQKLTAAVAMDALPPRERLTELRRLLRQYAGSIMRWFSSEYRATVREIKGFMQPGSARWSHQWLPPLDEAEQYLARVEKFAGDDAIARVLGAAFAGIDSNWQHIEKQLRWAQSMRAQGYAHERSMSLLKAWNDEPQSLRPEALADLLQRLLGELQQPLVLQMLQIGDTLPPHLSLEELARKVADCIAALSQWEQACGSLRAQADTTVIATHHAARAIQQAAQLHERINSSVQYRHLFGPAYTGTDMNALRLHATHDWMVALAALELPDAAMQWLTAEAVAQRLDVLRQPVVDLHHAAARVMEQRQTFRTWGEMDATFLPLVGDDEQVLHPAAIGALREQLPALLPWSQFWRAVRQLESHALLPLGMAVARGEVAADGAADVYELSVYEAAAEEAVRSSTTLSSFSRAGIENVRQRFQRLDGEVFELNRLLAAKSASELRPPDGISKGRVGEYTEMGLIRNEVQKQQRFCKLRELIRRAGAAMQALKPCFMMSPLSVAQYLEPGSIKFDVVIMDEASQIKPEDAVGSILRAKQMVVVGDPNQLPPTSFFERMGDIDDRDDEELTLLDDNESVLEVARKAMPSMRRLKWHFRSQHESLIAFSNHYFYDGDLIVFPSPSTAAATLGVYFEHVPEASFKTGRNAVEAQAVAKAIVEHAKHYPQQSLGVGAFNIQQRDLIQDHLDMLMSMDAEARAMVEPLLSSDDPLFIKNLENLQGDERDVIFISYTYGPDTASGRVMHRFGPLTGKHGWRRLNVLVTRARKRVKVFSSMQPEQIVLGESASRGVVSMRDYLDYARDGLLPDRGAVSDRPPDSDFEIAVARLVQGMGFAVRAQVGVAGYFVDIGVYHPDRPGEFVLGIECDGATYHSARSARDRDRIREAVILSRGWRLHRVWSTDWFHNRAAEERRLAAAIEHAIAAASPA